LSSPRWLLASVIACLSESGPESFPLRVDSSIEDIKFVV
jgi:hypothetical protein